MRNVLPKFPPAASLAALFLVAAPLSAQEADGDKPQDAGEPRVFTTHHVGTFHGTEVRYTATAGETFLHDRDGKPEASIFSVAYVADGVSDPSTRPVVFLWNGGPGSSSVWLHMGVFGPKRVDVPSDARDDGGPPYRMVDNPGAFLDVADVVFIDPMGTGFSRAVGDGDRQDHYGVTRDARSVARFLRQWVSDNERWNSPKFIGGESYGTTRSAAVVRELEGRWDDVSLNGIILVSAILDFSIENHAPGSELPNVMHLPTMAATAHYHGMAGEGTTVEEWVRQARAFALEQYAPALLLGDKLGAEQRAKVRAGLARLTGLSEDYLDRADLRLTPGRFQKELLRGRGLTVGRLDSRYTGVDMDDAGERTDADPSFYGIDGAYTATVNQWLREGLGVRFDEPRHYSIIGGLGGSWDWDLPGMSHYTNVAQWIGRAMRENSDLHVFVACGYYDFATPFFAAEYSMDRVGADHARITWAYYEAGHMMYVHHPSLERLQQDVRGFLLAALGHSD